MKKFVRVVIMIIAVVLAVIVAYYVADKNAKSNNSDLSQTTITQKEVTEKDTSEKILLFNSKKDNYHIYKQGKTVILEHNNKEYKFDNWSKYIDLEKPKVYATDIDRNGEVEILIRMVGNIDKNGKYNHYVYVLNESIDDNGEVDYFVTTFTQSSIVTLIDEMVTAEVSQIDNCKKTGIFAMCMNYTTIKYDKETNVPDSYYNLFRTLKDHNGNYLKITKWTRGLADFSVVKNAVMVSCPVSFTYADGSVQNAGIISCLFDLNDDNSVNVLGGTFVFEPNEEYKLFSYDLTTTKSRTNKIINTNKSIPRNTKVDFIDYDVSLDFVGEKKEDFSKNNGNLNCVSEIISTEKYVEFVAKKGCSFNEEYSEKNNFAIYMTSLDQYVESTHDVGYTAKVSLNDDGCEVLRLTYDKSYKSEVTKQTQIVFGE